MISLPQTGQVQLNNSLAITFFAPILLLLLLVDFQILLINRQSLDLALDISVLIHRELGLIRIPMTSLFPTYTIRYGSIYILLLVCCELNCFFLSFK